MKLKHANYFIISFTTFYSSYSTGAVEREEELFTLSAVCLRSKRIRRMALLKK